MAQLTTDLPKTMTHTACCSSQLWQLSRSMVRHLGMLNATCGDFPLSPVQAHASFEIDRQPLTIKQLADKLSIDKSNADIATKNLIYKDFHQSQMHWRDNRCVVVQLTTAGKKLLAKLDSQQNQLFQQILA